MKSGKKGLATATAQCNLFTLKIIVPPCPSEQLETSLKIMSNHPDESEINEFVDTFGTHAIKKLDMGAKFVAVASYDKKEVNRLKSEGLTVTFSGEVGAFGVGVGGKFK